uniref:Uncharacterized protein n=1 Tax=Escherichia coli TaxID=562 RepID=A0A2R4PDX3_ECOLX|nr:hypothetical protein [Escherichia coli]
MTLNHDFKSWPETVASFCGRLPRPQSQADALAIGFGGK